MMTITFIRETIELQKFLGTRRSTYKLYDEEELVGTLVFDHSKGQIKISDKEYYIELNTKYLLIQTLEIWDAEKLIGGVKTGSGVLMTKDVSLYGKSYSLDEVTRLEDTFQGKQRYLLKADNQLTWFEINMKDFYRDSRQYIDGKIQGEKLDLLLIILGLLRLETILRLD